MAHRPGLVPNEDSSGGKQRLGAITKHGNSYLRAMLVQGAWSVVRSADRNDPLRIWGETIMQRRSKRVGVVAVARRLAGVLWAMWRDSKAYDPRRLAGDSARGMRTAADAITDQAEALSRQAQTKPRQRRRRASSVEVNS